MGKPKLYINTNGPASRCVLLTVKALNLDLEIIPVNTHAGEQLKPEFVALNPQHTVPTLDDNSKVIWDSHSIMTYLATVYDKSNSLCPNDPYLRAIVDQRLHFESSTLFSRFAALFLPIFRGTAVEIDQEKLKTLFEAIDFLEIFLKDDLYMVGNTLTVADFCMIATMSTVFIVKDIILDPARYPKVLAWIERMKKLPYYEEGNGKYLDSILNMFQEKIKANKEINK